MNEQYIFLAVPFDRGSAYLRDAVNIASAEAGYSLMRADTQFAPSQSAVEEIRKAIKNASLVIGDVTDRNPNVMFELGQAQAAGKPILLLTQDPGSIPFDLAALRAVVYQPTSSLQALTARLSDAISEVLRGDAGPSAASDRRKVFVSYSHADGAYLDRILVHLRPLERSGAIDLWSDSKIRAGDHWRDEIRKNLDRARIAVLLVSADFLASEFIVTNELPPLLAAAQSAGVRIVPVILKPCRFLRDQTLNRFQALNDPRHPVIDMAEGEREALYAKLAELIETEVGIV